MVDYEHTSLKPYVEMFEKHVAAVLRDSRLAKKGECPSVGSNGDVLTCSIEGGEYGFLDTEDFLYVVCILAEFSCLLVCRCRLLAEKQSKSRALRI
jgi:hypothetical protein